MGKAFTGCALLLLAMPLLTLESAAGNQRGSLRAELLPASADGQIAAASNVACSRSRRECQRS